MTDRPRSASRSRPHAEIAIELAEPCPRWRAALARRRALCVTAVEAAIALAKPRLKRQAEVSLVLADDALVRRLNSTYRRKNAATNVLSFPALTAVERARAAAASKGLRPAPLGDVVAAFETSRREASALAKPLADHLSHLIVHGTLHLLGYDHEAARDAAHMERLERRVLASLGVPDPYGARRARAGRGKGVRDG